MLLLFNYLCSIMMTNDTLAYTPTPSSWPLTQTDFFDQPPHSLVGSQFLIYACLFLLCLLAVLRYMHPTKIQRTMTAGAKSSFASQTFRNQTGGQSGGSFLMNIIFAGSISMFLHYALPQNFLNHHVALRFAAILAGFLCYHYLKLALYHLVGILSYQQKTTLEFTYNVQIYMRILGICLLPIVIILSFPHIEANTFIYGLGFLIVFIILTALTIRASQILISSDVSVFYLILYLCTLEILPLLYIYKLLASLG